MISSATKQQWTQTDEGNDTRHMQNIRKNSIATAMRQNKWLGISPQWTTLFTILVYNAFPRSRLRTTGYMKCESKVLLMIRSEVRPARLVTTMPTLTIRMLVTSQILPKNYCKSFL